MKLLEVAQHAEIKNWLDQHGVVNYTIHDGETVDVDGDVSLIGRKLTSFPFQFGKVSGDFDCSNNNLTSLEGTPQSVGGYFDCSNNNLTSLQGAPQRVSGGFYCNRNNLTSLKWGPQTIGINFYCRYNKLTSLEGAPSHVGGGFDCSHNNLTSLHHIYKQIKQIDGKFYCDLVPNMLGILMIKGVKGIDVGDKEIEHIFNKHINGDIHACQEELIDAGYPEVARL